MAAYIAASFNLTQQMAELADPASTFLIADVGGVAAGYAKLHAGEPLEGVEGPNPVELVRLYASREWLGRGVGQALMCACVDEARQAGHRIMWLGVWERTRGRRSSTESGTFAPSASTCFNWARIHKRTS